ncbi:MAG: T9SS type A sorting domain-containing protein [Chitinophagales bacterium]|jgi:hypothetical protein|nr:T9SS type A sorting domain-containing protein [Chitinophagales bacterium]
MKQFFVFLLFLPFWAISQLWIPNSSTVAIAGNSVLASKYETQIIDSIHPLMNSGYLHLNATQRQFLALKFAPKLSINNVSHVELIQNSMQLRDSLHLQAGILKTNGFSVDMLQGSVIRGNFGNSTHVEGFLGKYGQTAFNFPMGHQGYYAPIEISAPSNPLDFFRAHYRHESPDVAGFFRNQILATLRHVSNVEYWELERIHGTSSVMVSLSYDSIRSGGISDVANLLIAKWDGSLWIDLGGVPSSLNAASGWIASPVLSSFGPLTLGSLNAFNPLPLIFKHVAASRTELGNKIEWTTYDEQNTEYFNIEFSLDNATFLEVETKIPAKGFYSGEAKYEAYHALNEKEIIYRVKQYDKDGNFSYSKKVLLSDEIVLNPESFSIEILENPIKSSFLTFQVLGIAQPTEAKIQIYNLLGKLVFESSFDINPNEKHAIDVANLSSGMYMMNYHDAHHKKSIKFIKSNF